MEPFEIAALLTGAFFLSFGLTAYRHFFKVFGAAAGLALWSAFREPIVRLPGLREHPGTAAVLILILFCAGGIILIVRFRRVIVFLGGLATGIILAGIFESYFTGGPLPTEPFYLTRPDPMGLLAGLVTGMLFLLFEKFFAVVLTTSLGAFLCFWALGGRWTFLLCFLSGLVVQLLVFVKFGRSNDGKGENPERLDNVRSRKNGRHR